MVFLVLFFTEGLMFGLVGGIIAAIAAFIYMTISYKSSDNAKAKLQELLTNQTIAYIDTASISSENKELTGALAVTNQLVIFARNTANGLDNIIEINLENIKTAENKGGFLVITENSGIVHTFKVFRCDAIIQAILGTTTI